ncbi:YgjP-like metallopeptidase domain-containing protein [Mycoplasmopsis verecunda]|uniref:Predicted metal-dependent hydrolase n=1 Tax=Mycoplasmopsis verecunda TaxID=171291 RepID=A0A1T4LR88_9BACT|nr:YgjP-like metallopeptidase domain-containing protein [Mycoplasmopsis verecunda]WPB54581.1 YgjP-like metallopeptidase domain-containing protein [Mycoplasmopsis verecunda]SJZ57157.1 Predicted metal-dependent hydrolase [Mycoplasmopsis verecunda]
MPIQIDNNKIYKITVNDKDFFYRLKDADTIHFKNPNKSFYLLTTNNFENIPVYIRPSKFNSLEEVEQCLKEYILKNYPHFYTLEDWKNWFYYLGQKLYFTYKSSGTVIIRLSDNDKIFDIFNCLPNKQDDNQYICKQVRSFLSKKFLELIKEISKEISQFYNTEYIVPSIKLNISSYLGICKYRTDSGECDINYNFDLSVFPIHVVSYVVAHEISHSITIGQKHNKVFWNTVAKYCPNYLIYKDSLKTLDKWFNLITSQNDDNHSK